MADEIDQTADREAFALEMTCKHASQAVALMPQGEPGECDKCGEYFARVVWIATHDILACGHCRDRWGLT
jgi:formylmethanofuran dehydrogenase subunit E